MWYVFRLLFIVPVIGIIAVVIYADLYVFFRNRRGKPGVPRALAEFILIGWVCMFVYVTQIMSFGGISAGPNFVPFGDFVTAFRYGSNNAHLVWQFLLNIIMMVPLGLLIPIVFPKKMRGFTGVTAVAFCASLATEVLQIFTGRGSDIDDLIANTLGGVCGFALWAILYTAANYALKRPSMRFARQAVIGLIILCLTAAPFIAVSIADGSSEFGN
ncbi:MAG: VanZ family protein, partial [Clostridiales bacterium]|nr:VanZ family protein [Clostridiales bacterium]